MAGPALARLRVELEADSASLERGLERAQTAFRKIATMGAAVGSALASAFIAMARRAADAIGAVLDVTSEFFQRMGTTGQVASLSIQNSFDRMRERALDFAATLADRALPMFARVIDSLSNLRGASIAAAAGMELIVFSLKLLTSGGALVIAVFESLTHIVVAAAKALMDAAKGDFQAAYDHLSEGARNVAGEVRKTFKTIADILNEVPLDERTVTGVLGPWQTIVRQSSEAADHLKLLRDEMMAALSDPTMAFTDRLAALQVALQQNLITTAKFHENLRKIVEIHERAMESSIQTVGSALTALFAKSKPAAIASALINTYVGITQALRSLPPPWSFVQAAAIGAMGFAQVRNIASTSATGGGGTAPSMSAGAGSAGPAVPSQMLTVQGLDPNSIMSGVSVRDLAERLLAFQRDGGQVVLA